MSLLIRIGHMRRRTVMPSAFAQSDRRYLRVHRGPNLAAVECEDRHTGPPYMAAARSHPEHLLTMVAVKAHLATYAIAFLNQNQHVRGVVAEGGCYPIHVFGELAMPD